MRSSRSGFTLIELMTVMMVVGILFLIVAQSSEGLRDRADFALCLTNLRSLYIGASNYIAEQEHWPQISPKLNANGSTEYAEQWYQALRKYGISRSIWVCPSIQRKLNHPDLDDPKNRRCDYIATPFDKRPRTPYLWSTQPWFVEKSAAHPGGNLLIYADAQAMPMKEAIRRTYTEP